MRNAETLFLVKFALTWIHIPPTESRVGFLQFPSDEIRPADSKDNLKNLPAALNFIDLSLELNVRNAPLTKQDS